MKLGKLPAQHDDRIPRLARYLERAEIPVPASAQWHTKVKDWPMDLNDTLGDCAIAAASHMEQLWSTYAQATPVILTDDQVLTGYEAFGYNPADPSTDQGCILTQVLPYWMNTGFAGRKVAGFATLEPQNNDETRAAIALFGAAYIGLQLPLTAQGDGPWELPPGGAVGRAAPGTWGGHCVPLVGYGRAGLTAVTWGALKQMSWSFLNAYMDEAYAVLSTDWMTSSGQAPSGLDWTSLMADMSALAAPGSSG